jgi:hypothetical protein
MGCRVAAMRCIATIQTVIIPSRHPQPVDRGIYRAGWKPETLPDGAAFYNDSPAAALIEYGVRGENVKIGRKLLAALAEWAIRKGLVTKDDPNAAQSLAWAIAKKAASGKGFHNQKPGGGQQIMGECNATFTTQYTKEAITRELER